MTFELWEIVAPKVKRDLDVSCDSENEKKEEANYLTEVTSKEVTLYDMKTALMAILKYNDGKRFVEASKAPLPQSEGEIGFRKLNEPTGKFMLRYEELGML